MAVLYVIAAKLGLSLAFSIKQVTTVWPPSGLALAALLLFGLDLWPGVAIGAFAANFLTNEPAWVAVLIAVGNTLEALVGASLLKRIVDFKSTLHRVKGVVGLVFLAGVLSTMVAATIGTTSLRLGHLLTSGAQPSAWLLWWFGDMTGVLLFAPFLLVWLSNWRQVTRQKLLEFGALLMGTLVVAEITFFGQLKVLGNRPQVTYLIFPFVIWAAFRFRQLGVTAVSLITATVAILGTINGFGPFLGVGTPQQQLVTLLLYIIFMTISGLLMGVAVLQRDNSESKLVQQAAALQKARGKILKELNAKSANEERLEASNERITSILSHLLEENPTRPTFKK